MKIRPPAGYCFVEPIQKFQDGVIVFPDIVKAKKQQVGTVLDVTPYPDHDVEIFDNGERLTVNGATQNDLDFDALIGSIVIYDNGQRMEGKQLDKVRLDSIVAIIDADTKVDIVSIDVGGVPRCNWCKSAGEGNILTDGDGFCIQCKRDKIGRYRKDVDLTGKIDYDEVQHEENNCNCADIV